MYIMGCCPVKKSPPARQVLGAFFSRRRYTGARHKREMGKWYMRRILGCFFLAVALGVACLYTWRLGWPALRGEAGPCTVTVTCPGGPSPAVYSYDLVGAGFCRTIHIFYDPAYPGDNYGIFQNLPPGEYRLLENGWERSRVQVSLEAPAVAVWPDHTWPIAVAR